jgi:hypothetical protein
MQSKSFSVMAIALLALAIIPSAPAAAQSRVLVAAQGSDANPCSFAQPCRTLQHAHDVVAAGGEIDVLDPAGYGALQIRKPISIQGHGFAEVSVPAGTDAITIVAGASDRITLRGLVLDGGGSANTITSNTGINIGTAGTVDVDDCVIRNFDQGISDNLGGASLFVSNSLITHMTFIGIFVRGAGNASTRASVSRTEVNDTQTGIQAQGETLAANGSVDVSISDSNVFASSLGGVAAVNFPQSVGPVTMVVTRSSIVGGATGVVVNGPSTLTFIRLDETAIALNDAGWSIIGSGGTLTSWGNNAFNDNGGNGDGAVPITSLH